MASTEFLANTSGKEFAQDHEEFEARIAELVANSLKKARETHVHNERLQLDSVD